MAYYPAQDMIVLKAKTEEEIDNEIKAKMAEGYFPVSGTVVYNGKLSGEPVAYKQSMVKLENTDLKFIASMFAAFKPSLDAIYTQLTAINDKLSTANDKLSTANSSLSSIAANTDRIPNATNVEEK